MYALRRLPPKRPLPVYPVPKLVHPPVHEGLIDELSDRHVSGWLWLPQQPDARPRFEVLLADTGEILARGLADQFADRLAALGKGDGAHGYYARLPRLLSSQQQEQLRVRAVGSAEMLWRATWLRREFNPLMHVAMDIVDNCNLRCPFCLYDYANTNATHMMEEATLQSALRFLPYTRDGEFWFSCLHEPTLHPRMTDFIDQVPLEYRRKVFFTTNLAKRMPAAYFAWLAGNGMHHINISIESRDPAIYERMRKGARHRIFMANWDALLEARSAGSAPPRLRYIMMAYKSNVREIPELAAYLLAERQASQVEVRYTYDVPHIPTEFKAAEYLEPHEWQWLREALAHHAQEQVELHAPPGEATVAVPAAGRAGEIPLAPRSPADDGSVLPGRYMFRVSWDGTVRVQGILASSRGNEPDERQLAVLNIRDIHDPAQFIASLAT